MKCKKQHWSGRYTCNLTKGHKGNHMQLIDWEDKSEQHLEDKDGSNM